MKSLLGLATPLYGSPPEDPLADRLRLALETPRGAIPWRPAFGLALDDLLGQPLTQVAVHKVQQRVRAALREARVDAPVAEIRVRVVSTSEATERPRSLPIAERAIVPLGAQASLLVELTILGPDGPTNTTLTFP